MQSTLADLLLSNLQPITDFRSRLDGFKSTVKCAHGDSV